MCRLCTREAVVDTVTGILPGMFYPACPSVLRRICSQYQEYLQEDVIEEIRAYLERICIIPRHVKGRTPGLDQKRLDGLLKRVSSEKLVVAGVLSSPPI